MPPNDLRPDSYHGGVPSRAQIVLPRPIKLVQRLPCPVLPPDPAVSASVHDEVGRAAWWHGHYGSHLPHGTYPAAIAASLVSHHMAFERRIFPALEHDG